ncbi:MAG: GGDEF domain-containing protein [Clostridia bacterium]|nr:GGDEF domain-containing protein [Clostridia bacterium]
MSNFIGTEPKIFCLLIIAFLYAFQTGNFQIKFKENKLLYLFAFTEILFSILGDFVPEGYVKSFCFAICGVSCFTVAYLGLKYAFEITECKVTTVKKCACALLCIAFGVLAFYSLSYGFNGTAFIMVFVILAMLLTEQSNKIKVDNLTKLYNRYGMDAELKEQLRQYEREHSDSFYIIACDLDRFKHINDTWGHPEGDRALILVAGALSKVAKKFDSEVFRIGGDEFVIITDKSDEGLAEKVTSAVKNELDNIDFRSDFDIRMSIGVALYDGATPIDELLSNADKKLYEAKRKTK